MRGGWEQKRVLIIVKTYPNPSSKHREIVCTAGIDLESGKLIRLFPIPFRMLAEGDRFHKWQFVSLEVRKAPDPRPESFEVRDGSIEPGEIIPTTGNGWARRWQYVEPLIASSIEELEANPERPSLGIIKPGAEVTMSILPHKNPEFNSREKRKLLGDFGHDTLFGDFRKYRHILEKIPWKFRYHFLRGPSGDPYTAYFEDWEVGEAYRKWKRTLYPDPEVLKEQIQNKFLVAPKAAGNLYLAVGTHSRRQHQWLAIGILMPKLDHKSTVKQESLFDI